MTISEHHVVSDKGSIALPASANTEPKRFFIGQSTILCETRSLVQYLNRSRVHSKVAPSCFVGIHHRKLWTEWEITIEQ